MINETTGDLLTLINMLLNVVMIGLLYWAIKERKRESQARREDQVTLMRKSRTVYEHGVAAGESRLLQNLASSIGAGVPVEHWLAHQVELLGEQSQHPEPVDVAK